MFRKAISSCNAPKAIGPYSCAMKLGDFVYISGQLPIDASSGNMPETIEEQTKQSLANIEALLRSEQGFHDENFILTLRKFKFNTFVERFREGILDCLCNICYLPKKKFSVFNDLVKYTSFYLQGLPLKLLKNNNNFDIRIEFEEIYSNPLIKPTLQLQPNNIYLISGYGIMNLLFREYRYEFKYK